MLARINTGTVVGLDGVMIEAEVDVAGRGFPTFTIVGLPSKTVDEAKDRVRTAIVNAQFEMPDSRITVNLAPADLPKIGSAFDLPIAVGILAASGMINRELLEKSLFIGELSLEGKVRTVPGVLSVSLMAKEQKIEYLFVPRENSREASYVDGITVIPVDTLNSLVLHLNGISLIPSYTRSQNDISDELSNTLLDFAEVRGQEVAKRALTIAAAGFHNLHLKGVPGAGKTMLSRAFPSILPPLEYVEMLDVYKIYSVVSQLGTLHRRYRPFRSPHHTTSKIGLIGGGAHPIPGEISLAHRGVLFLDELPEFPRGVLEALRQPLEDGMVTIARAAGSISFPCRFLLLAASNPCPCGYLGHPKKKCNCLPGMILKYKKRLSGPLLDRIDLHIGVNPVEDDVLIHYTGGEPSVKIRERVVGAYERQKARFKDTGIHTNGEMNSSHVRKFCKIEPQALSLLKIAIERFSLSARSYFKIIKVAQTIADLEGKESIDENAIAEALQYRPN